MARQMLSTEETLKLDRERVPVGEARDKLRVLGLDHDNFAYRFVNITDEDNMRAFLGASWKFVTKDPKGNPTTQHIDAYSGVDSCLTKSGGKGITLALMALPIELFEADQKREQDKITEFELEMKRDLEAQADPRYGGYGKIEHVGPAMGSRMRLPPKLG